MCSRKVSLCINVLFGVSLLYASLPCATGLRYVGHYNGSDEVCIYLDTIFKITVAAYKGDKQFTREFTDRDVDGITHTCENDTVENVAFIKFDLRDSLQLNDSGIRFQYTYNALQNGDVIVDISTSLKPIAISQGISNPDPLVVLKNPETLYMGSRNYSFVCTRERTTVFEPEKTRDGYTYSLTMERSYFETQAFNIKDHELSPAFRCQVESNDKDDNALIIGCVAGSAVVISLVAVAVIFIRRNTSKYQIL